MSIFRSINTAINRWFTAPESNAAGRMGLYRIIYGLFYLWAASPLSYYAMWRQLPPDQWGPIRTFRWIPASQLPILFQVMPVALLVGLALLTIGFRTRLATLLVLISGIFLTGAYYSFMGKIDHADTFLVAYIPVVMLFSNWNSNYSVDAWLQKKRGVVVEPADSSWRYIWPMRVIMLVAALMFFGAGFIKLRGGDWLNDMQLFPNLLLNQNAIAVVRLKPPNPLNPIIASIPLIHIPLQLSGICFELCFPLAIVNRRLRNFFVSAAIIFHTLNTFLLRINAWPLLILYLAFVDWQSYYARWWPLRKPLLVERLSPRAIMALAAGVAILTPVLWSNTKFLALFVPPFDSSLIWYAAVPFALVALVRAAFGIVKSAATTVRMGSRLLREPQPLTQD